MQRAELLSVTDPSAAQKTWERVDRQLTDAAECVPTVTYRDLEITSPRVGNYEFNPVWGFLATRRGCAEHPAQRQDRIRFRSATKTTTSAPAG